MITRLIFAVLLLLFAQNAKAETVMHCKMSDRDFPSGRHESWIITDTHFRQLGARYEWLDLPGLAHKKITSRSEGVVAATWDHAIEGTYSFEANLGSGVVVETAISRLSNKTVYGKCWIIDRQLDGSVIPPHEEWKIP
jgi:hypothetical protein